MRTFVGLILLGITLTLLVSELVALADPVGTGLSNDADPYGPPAPWYVHAGWFIVIALMGWVSMRLLNGGILGRLVRGRGFTPAER
jgi:hypothetical protein